VRLARALAREGWVTLRCDFSGIGDSPPRGDTLPFEKSAVLEAQAAMDALAVHGARRFVLVGLCSGAEIAFKSACADERVVAAALINAPRFLVEPAASVTARLEREHDAHYTWRVALKNPASWRKLLSGRADLKSIVGALRARLSSVRPAAELPETAADRKAFDDLARRGVRLLLCLSEGDWGQGYLRLVLGDERAERDGRRLRVLPACDHLMTPRDTSARLVDDVTAWLGTLQAASFEAKRPSATARASITVTTPSTVTRALTSGQLNARTSGWGKASPEVSMTI
jgi:hypothetical protein